MKMRWGLIVDGCSIAALFAAGYLYFAGPTESENHDGHDHTVNDVVTEISGALEMPITGLPGLGSDLASVVIVEFSDYHCPYCIRYARSTFPQVRDGLVQPGVAQYFFVQSPLVSARPAAGPLARTALCLARDGRFWDAHEHLFGAGKSGDRALAEVWKEIGISSEQVAQCETDPTIEADLQRNLDLGDAVGLSGTPTFLLGRRGGQGEVTWAKTIKGAQTYSFIESEVRHLIRNSSSAPSIHK